MPEEQQKPSTPPSPTTSGEQVKRPTSLVLKCNRSETVTTSAIVNEPIEEPVDEEMDDEQQSQPQAQQSQEHQQQQQQNKKFLYRSNSSSIHKRLSSFVPTATTSATNKFKLSSELDKIFVISSNRPTALNSDDDDYDSIEVIDERRMKNMPKSDRARLYKSNTFICEEYYTNEQLADVIGTEATSETETTINEKP